MTATSTQVIDSRAGVFLDTGYLVALEDADEGNHPAAREHLDGLGRMPTLTTTSYVLDEVVTFFNVRGQHAKAVELGEMLLDGPSVRMVHVGENLLRRGFGLLRDRPDKGYSLTDCVSYVAMRERGIEFVSLRESLDTTTPGGKLVFHVFGAVAEFERDIIRERTMAGLEAARARWRKGGRKPVVDEKKLALASAMLKNKEIPVREVCEAVGVSRSTLYRHLKPDGTAR